MPKKNILLAVLALFASGSFLIGCDEEKEETAQTEVQNPPSSGQTP